MEPEILPRRLHVVVTGRVQGVNFRYATREQARRRGLSGWARNLADGRVEAVFEGAPSDLELMLDWCRHGPPAAEVESVDVKWGDPIGDERGFSIRG